MWSCAGLVLIIALQVALAEENVTMTPPDTMNVTAEADILILGAGMAGISAAAHLKKSGKHDFIIIEGSSQVGGRVKEAKLGNYTVELGAMWIHGGKANPLMKYAERYNLSYRVCNCEDYTVFGDDGENLTDAYNEAYERFEPAYASFQRVNKELRKKKMPDMSLGAMLRAEGWFPSTPVEMMAEYFDIDFESAVPPDMLSGKYFSDATYTDFSHNEIAIKDLSGYRKIIRGIKDDTVSPNDSTQRLYLESVVSSVKQNDTHVTVTTDDGRVFIGKHAIITFSSAVLQRKLVKFEPEFPEWKWNGLYGLNPITYHHFYIQFPTAFWDDNEWILYASNKRGYFPVWQNLNKLRPGCNILQATNTHFIADTLIRMSDEEIKQEAMKVLRTLYGPAIPDPSNIVVPRWTTDPLFMCMYTDILPGMTKERWDAIRAPIGRLHFAGEHTSVAYYGYLHGAHFEGIDAADQVMACQDGDSCKAFVPPWEARGCTYKGAVNYDVNAKVDDGSCKIIKCPTSGVAPLFSSMGYAIATMMVIIHVMS